MAKFRVGEQVRIQPERPDSIVAGKQGVVLAFLSAEEVQRLWSSKRFRPIDTPQQWYRVKVKDRAFCAAESCLRKLLPESDCYHPADISIDDLMRSVREVEHV